MKSAICVFIVASLCTAPILLGQTNVTSKQVHARHSGTNSATASGMYSEMTNVVTATGTLIVEQLAEVENPTTHKPMLVTVNAGASGTGGDKHMTLYCLLAADGSSVTSFGAETAATAPVKVSDCIDQFVTLVGKGRELQGKSGKVIQIMKITAITKIPAPPGAQPVVKVSGILGTETLIRTDDATPHYSVLPRNGTNGIGGDKQMTLYVVTAADGSRVTSFGAATASTSPLAIGDFLNQSVTIVGWGRELQGKPGKLIQIRKITGIAKNPDAPEAAPVAKP